MDAPTKKALFLETPRTRHAAWETLLAKVDAACLVQPGPLGRFSLF
jgi:hypothetical protein